MKYRRLENKDTKMIKTFLESYGSEFNSEHLTEFIKDKNNYGFIAKENDKIVGFIYGYSLLRPDGRYIFYIHSVDVLPEYRNKGIGKKLFKYMIEYLEKEKEIYKCFVLSEKGNTTAKKLYKKQTDKKYQLICYEKIF